MLIYDFKKKFMAVDENTLRLLGFDTLEGVLNEVDDFAELFVAQPGFIYNFNHMHWLDYLACSGDAENRVQIRAKDKVFLASLSMESIYTRENPSQKAFCVYLNNLRLTQGSSSVIQTTPPPKQAPKILQEPKIVQEIAEPTPPKIEPLNIILDNEPIKEQNITHIIEVEDKDDAFKDYVYNPNKASAELKLPLEVINEFIEDFIAQANGFKNELYDSLNSGDTKNLKNLSHKLKGVAANLRVENALDALTIVNTSNSDVKIAHNLDKFYHIIDTLSMTQTQKESMVVKEPKPVVLEEPKVEIKKDIFELSLDDLAKDIVFEEQADGYISSYDISKVASQIGLDVVSFKELLKDFIQEAKEICQSIATEAIKKDYKNVALLAKKLMGMSENIKLHEINDYLKRVATIEDKEQIKVDIGIIMFKLNELSSKVE